jgi:PAS domain S-box-containing protein
MIKKLHYTLDQEQQILLNEAESLAQMGSWKWTEHNDELVWSEGLYRIFGKDIEEVILWESFLENIIAEDAAMVNTFLGELKRNKPGASINYRINIDGQVRYLFFTVKPHSKLNIDILGAVVDITEHKEDEIRLQQSHLLQSMIIKELDAKEKKYRLLFERSIDPIFLASSKHELVDANHSFLQLFGYDAMNQIPLSLTSLFSFPKDYQLFKAALQDQGFIREFEVSLMTGTGERKTCLLNCVYIPDQASDLGYYQCIIHDLTMRKKAESEMLIAERFSLTGRIARTMAHEVRNPLANLNLALDQLQDELTPDNKSAKLYSEIIARSAHRIDQLVTELLTSSKPNELTLALTNVDTLIKETILTARDRIELNHIQLNVTCEATLPRLLVDKEKIKVALLNIIINAIEAMVPDVGMLTITALRQDSSLLISIADNGKGILDSDLSSLFDPFFTRKPMGMGLGLTSTKNILNSHNVQVEVRSEVGSGTTFILNFILPEQ